MVSGSPQLIILAASRSYAMPNFLKAAEVLASVEDENTKPTKMSAKPLSNPNNIMKRKTPDVKPYCDDFPY